MALLKELADRAKRSPGLSFLMSAEKNLNYGQTHEAVGKVAGTLAKLGVQPGDRVVVILPNSVDYCVLTYAIFHAGAIAVLVNPRWTAHEMEGAVKLTRPKLVIAPANEGEYAKLSVTPTPLATVIAGRDAAIERRKSPTGTALMLLTSGTTGKSKAVMLTQEALAANASQLAKRKQITENDRFLCSIPLFHSNGQVAALHSMLMGGSSMVILDRFTPESLLENVAKHGITAITGVPTLYQHLVNYRREHAVDLSSVRICVSGSAPMPVSLIDDVQTTLGGSILEGYGLTECCAGACGNPLNKRKPGTVGLPLDGTEVKIVDGEIWIKGPQLMQGYFEDPDATNAAISPDGWLRSGDLGQIDQDGYVTILSRKKELIIRGGFNVYPAEVESVLREIDGVLDVTVVGLPDQLHGESVHAAFITELEDREIAERILRHSADKLARYKRPTSFSMHRDFPRTGSAKVQKHNLAAELKTHPDLVHKLG
jgi:long-chain acyl-CoA synthetase